MTRVLFVDDEPRVLDGLRDLLRKRRREWAMTFVCGGPEAIARLAAEPFDIIVTDMRMPDADGIAVLRAAAEHCPAAARLVLSGQAVRGSVLEALAIAHQFLSKPCEPGALQSALDDLIALEALLTPPLRAMAAAVPRLPSGPSVHDALAAAAVRPHTSVDEFADIVAQDPAMAAKVLQVVNSSFLGRAETLGSAAAAVASLGVEQMRGLALTAKAFVPAGTGTAAGDALEAERRHAVAVASAARQLCPDAHLADTAYTAGLLHDIGKLVLAAQQPEEAAALARHGRDTGAPAHQVEHARLGASHAEIGAYLLGLWGLPAVIVDAVAHHHLPERAPNNPLVAVLADAHDVVRRAGAAA